MDSSDDDDEDDYRKREHDDDAVPENKGKFVDNGMEIRFPMSVTLLQ